MNDMTREDLFALVTNKEGWTRRDKEPTMRRVERKNLLRLVVIVAVLAVGASFSTTASAQTIVDEWANVKVPPPPELKPVTIDAKTTALLMIDFMKPTCNVRPRCVASVPAVKKFLSEARAKGMMVVYTTGPGGKVADTVQDVAPTGSEPVFTAGPDKFLNTDLDKILNDKGIQTVITIGTLAQGGVLFTASAAGLRGMKVIVPVDGMSAEAENTYAEQYTAWHLANAPVFSRNVTLTKFDMVKF